ncbi:uncharacterized protein [Apostichopus japonicus]|uniref:uncharacterized protein n=1 Tax=Stichopus japonicus TaxID=307972 RepID=UPI003AB663A9
MTGNGLKAVVIFGLLLRLAFGDGESESISCGNQYLAELGKPYVIVCNASAEQRDIYWFKGEDTSSFPILTLEDGRYGGGEYQKGEYELTKESALKVINTQLKHEGKYTVRVYFNEFDFDTTTTELKVYIRSEPPCPLIDACGSTCTGCQLNVTTSGSLTCYVNGSRPMMEVDWIVTNQSGVSFTKKEQTHQEMDNRWYTKKTIGYTTPDCGADAIFRCTASLSDLSFVPLLDTYSSTVRIKTEACKEPTSSEPTSSPTGQVAWPFVVIGIVIILVILVIIACFFYQRRGTSIQIQSGDPDTEKQTTNSEPKPKQKTKSLKERKKKLVDVLIKQYEKFGFIKPLPWGEPIPIQAFYTTCRCIVTNAKGDVSHRDSDFLSTPEFNNESTNRVIVTADLGYGKTTFTQHLVSDWVSKMTNPKVGKKNQTSEPILIYIHLKEVVPSMILSELVKKMMPVGIDLTVDDIIEIFQNFEFQVLLDGLDELSMSTISANTSAENPTNDKEELVNLFQEGAENYANLTVANLLENTINTKFKNIKVWVTSREFDDMKTSFALPYSKVKLNGFSNNQVNEYIQKTCKYYFNSQAIPQLSLILDSNMSNPKSQAKSDAKKHETIEEKTTNNDSLLVTEGGCNNEVTTKLIKQGKSEQKDNTVPRNVACDTLEMLSKRVYECMELNEIVQNFSETPLLLIMIIHIITCRMLEPTGKYKEMNVNKLTTIIRLVITCLESRYVQKVDKMSIQKDIKSLEDSLGKIAFENKMSLSLGEREYWNNELGEKDTQLAVAVGLLKYSKKVGGGGSQLEELAFSSYAGIMFYHEFFQEFLAAQYVPKRVKEWAWIDELIKNSTDDATVRLLQFMFGMNHARLDKAVQSLKEQQMWDNLIDCIYEISNLEKKQEIITKISKGTIHIQHLDRKHHRVALTDFCDVCNSCDVNVKRMTFREECAIDFIKDVTLPSLETLQFLEMNINEDQFVSIITSLTNRKCPEILMFKKCSVSNEVKQEAKKTEKSALRGLTMKISFS